MDKNILIPRDYFPGKTLSAIGAFLGLALCQPLMNVVHPHTSWAMIAAVAVTGIVIIVGCGELFYAIGWYVKLLIGYLIAKRQ